VATSTVLQPYGWTTIVLHWLGVFALVVSFLTGEALEDIGDDGRAAVLADHLLWASILAVPLLARIGWRMREGFLRTADQRPMLHLDTSKNLAIFGVICFNLGILGGIEACRTNLAFSMSMTVYAS
jgi:cytochrome b561